MGNRRRTLPQGLDLPNNCDSKERWHLPFFFIDFHKASLRRMSTRFLSNECYPRQTEDRPIRCLPKKRVLADSEGYFDIC